MVTFYKYSDSGLDTPSRPAPPSGSSPCELTAYAKDFVDAFCTMRGSYYGKYSICTHIFREVFKRAIKNNPPFKGVQEPMHLNLDTWSIDYYLKTPKKLPAFLLIYGVERGEIYKGSHAVAIKVDFKTRRIEYQDSHGIGMPYATEKAFLEKFPGFTIKNHAVKQQGQDPACAFYALLNLLQFAQGLAPIKYTQEELVAIRKDHAAIVLDAAATAIEREIRYDENPELQRILTAIKERDERIEVPMSNDYNFVPDLIRLDKTTLLQPRTRSLFGKPQPT